MYQADEEVNTEPGITLEFLSGGGAMGIRIRAYPWALKGFGRPSLEIP
jgi:hypothetical protein